MNWNKAIELLENGEASMVVTQAVLLSVDGEIWLSFDGEDWEQSEMRTIKKQFQ